MAQRPVFTATKDRNLFSTEIVDFKYFPGFALSQNQKSIQSLHDAFKKLHPDKDVLEISSKSKQEEGKALGAFNLKIQTEDGLLPLEIVYHAAKVFEKGGPYKEVLKMTSGEANTYIHSMDVGKVIAHEFEGKRIPAVHTSLFYNWLYAKAVSQNPELKEKLLKYDHFTSILMVHKKTNDYKEISCQAIAAAIYVSLCRQGLDEEALKSPEDFLRIVY